MGKTLRKIAIYSQKGGVGKSTLTSNLAMAYATIGQKTLIIDADSQNDQTVNFGLDKKQYNKTFTNLILDNADAADCIIKVAENLFLMPNSNITEVERYLYTVHNIKNIFQEKLKVLEDMGFNYVFIDLPPSKSLINNGFLYYIKNLIMPVQLTVGSTNSIVNTLTYLQELKLNEDKIIKAVIPNMQRSTSESRECLNVINSLYKDKVTIAIDFSTKVSRVVNEGKTVFQTNADIQAKLLQVLQKVVPLIE